MTRRFNPDPLALIAKRLRALQAEHGYATWEVLAKLAKLLDAPPARRVRVRNVQWEQSRYEALLHQGLCVRCRKLPATEGVRCKSCREDENRLARERYRKEREAVGDKRYRCRLCRELGHTRAACPKTQEAAA